MSPAQSILLISPYLSELSANIRARPIPWEGYARAGLISESDVKAIKAIDKQSSQKRKEILESINDMTAQNEKQRYGELVMALVSKMKRVDILQYVLVLAGDLVEEDPSFVKTLLDTPVSKNENGDKGSFGPWLRLLKNEDDSLPLLSAKVLTYLLAANTTTTLPREVLSLFFEWYRSVSLNADSDLQNLSVQTLSPVLRSPSARLVFWENEGNTTELVQLLKSHNSTPGYIQLQYNTLLIFWILTFEHEICTHIQARLDIIPVLAQVAKASVKEKITRLSISILRNLSLDSANTQAMLHPSLNLLSFIGTLKNRKWGDVDLIEDLDYLHGVLEKESIEMTSFDAWVAELRSGIMQPSPLHASPDFFSENGAEMASSKATHLSDLTRLLSSSTDEGTQAVVLNDMRMLMENYAEGRSALSKCGVKGRVMELMSTGTGQVRYEALGVAKLLLSRTWETR